MLNRSGTVHTGVIATLGIRLLRKTVRPQKNQQLDSFGFRFNPVVPFLFQFEGQFFRA
jgi:hypothetical protein